MIIAVDGPTASGKGTIAKALAAHFGLPHLDTGLLYRAVGVNAVRLGGDPDNPDEALAGCAFDDALLADAHLRSETAGGLASRASRHPAVRAALLERQRSFARQPGGAVLDGRDIGTVIAPEADAKLFVTASVAARAGRRCNEMLGRGEDVTLEEIVADLAARDARDSGRSIAPLKPACDALLLDTSDLTIGQAVQRAIELVNGRTQGGHSPQS
ncbi:MAG: (d)CMP kinase [Blastomonas fulva]|jgi:cytidylate kinase|uniref:Cytidylate kinase n=1 Tax=Blastomonas fulva TaxID=1550728 RepID=A0ABM6M6Z0_9SPHN|nr:MULTISPECIES: d(CMP) kinase [Blastomonas]AOG00273.1 cytidylate kinase [Blastomonas sp. RAC04]ASR51565.1 cytidylate kinase [Blastomonas fulva]KPF76902.1 cytidylate kinase [Blastomonas sp. AAP25]MCO5794667.1 (d)CMP kinase [Blastomonas sp.]MDK2757042.1 cytidylate kinase [Blastomonas fulva]